MKNTNKNTNTQIKVGDLLKPDYNEHSGVRRVTKVTKCFITSELLLPCGMIITNPEFLLKHFKNALIDDKPITTENTASAMATTVYNIKVPFDESFCTPDNGPQVKRSKITGHETFQSYSEIQMGW